MAPPKKNDLDQLGERLKELRNHRTLSQVELAEVLGIGQTALSHAESRSDMKLSTLQNYIRALGGELELQAYFPDLGRRTLLGLPALIEANEQLHLPGIPVPEPRGRDIVLSVKPRFAEKILDGSKTVELRRRFSSAVPSGARAWIYSTTPIKAMTGAATISAVKQLPLLDLWKRYKDAVAVTRSEFNSYFDGVDDGYAILLSAPHTLANPVPLSDLRSFCEFEPPQSYQYAPSQLSHYINGDWAKAPN
jgi:predicted transcriptional regulator/DNA-binding XRE family transcriptional regulator